MRTALSILCFSAILTAAAHAEGLSPSEQKALRELELSVSQTKEDTLKTKERVQELEEAVLRGKITGSKALISFENEADGFFALSTAEFYVDEDLALRVNSDDKKKAIRTLSVFDRDIPPGDHKLRTKLIFRGSDKSLYSAFPYFKDHEFEIESAEPFTVEYGKTTQVKVTAMDKGYFKVDLKERLALKVTAITEWGTEAAK